MLDAIKDYGSEIINLVFLMIKFGYQYFAKYLFYIFLFDNILPSLSS